MTFEMTMYSPGRTGGFHPGRAPSFEKEDNTNLSIGVNENDVYTL